MNLFVTAYLGSSLRLFSSPEIFIPLMIFLIILCIILLILLQKEKHTQQITNIHSTTENEVYSRMYGDVNSSKSFLREEMGVTERKSKEISDTQFIPDPDEGEEYQTAVIVQKEGQNPGSKYFIDKSEVQIGSGEETDIVLWDSSVSKKHAKIKRIGNKFVLFDQVSLRGVFLNGKKLLRPRVLYDFDEIRLGKTILVFRGK